MEQEIWKDIEGYEGRYQISNYGQVRSVDRFVNSLFGENTIKRKGKVIKPFLVGRGYCSVMLGYKGAKKYVHRLVAESFLINPNKLEQVNHKNGIKTDNNVQNLEWVNQSKNMIHSVHVLGNNSYLKASKAFSQNCKRKREARQNH